MPKIIRRLLWLWAFHLITKNHTWCAREAQTKHIIRHSSARWKRRKNKKNNKRKAMFMNYEYSFVVAIGGGGGGDGTTECDGSPNIYLCSDWMLGFFRSIIHSLSSVNCSCLCECFSRDLLIISSVASRISMFNSSRPIRSDGRYVTSETNAHRECV